MFNRLELKIIISNLDNWDEDFGRFINFPAIKYSGDFHSLLMKASKQEREGITESKEIREIQKLRNEAIVRGVLSKELIFTMGYEYIVTFYSIVENAFGFKKELMESIVELIENVPANPKKDWSNAIRELFALRHCIAHCNGYVLELRPRNQEIIRDAINSDKKLLICSNNRIYLSKTYIQNLGYNLNALLTWFCDEGQFSEVPMSDFLDSQEKVRKEIDNLTLNHKK